MSVFRANRVLGLFALAALMILLIPTLSHADTYTWTAQTGSVGGNWHEISSSSDFTKLTAAVYGGYIYTSTDSGATWTARTGAGSRSWLGVPSSSDGTKLAAADNSGYIYTSTDSGATWTARTGAGSRGWGKIVSSSDGSKLAASVGNNGYSGYIYTSSDSGATWTERTGAGSRNWPFIASSSDGTKLAAGAYGGYIYTSTDSGDTWTARTSAGSRGWFGIASSSDGTKLAAVEGYGYNGYIYTSTDSGATWTARTGSGGRGWYGISSSSDGTKLASGVGDGSSDGYLYTSTDSGATWNVETGAGNKSSWRATVFSSDGSRIAATACCGDYNIYTGVSSSSGNSTTTTTKVGSTTTTTGTGSSTTTTSTTFSKYITYSLPYLHTNTNNVVYCEVSNNTAADTTGSIAVLSNSTGTTPTQKDEPTGISVMSKATSMITFSGSNVMSGSTNVDITSNTGNTGANLQSVYYSAKIAFGTNDNSTTCDTIGMACFQGTTSPRRNIRGYVCNEGNTVSSTTTTTTSTTNTFAKYITYTLPYLHTSTSNVVYCEVSNTTASDATASVAVLSNSSGTTPTQKDEPTGISVMSKQTSMVTFSGSSVMSGSTTVDITNNTGNTGSNLQSVYYSAKVSYGTNDTSASCDTIGMTCFQGTTSPRRNLLGYTCSDKLQTTK